MSWMWFVFLAIMGLSSYNIAGKIAGGKIEPLLSTTIATLTAAIVLSIMTLAYYWKKDLSFSQQLTSDGVNTSILIGLTIIIINIGYIFAFAKGGPVGIVGPVINGGSIIILIIASALFFGEGMSVNKVLGAISLGVGIMFLIKG